MEFVPSDLRESDAGVADRDDLGITVFEDIVPKAMLDRMNADIDATRDQWPSAHGGSGIPLAVSFADLLRRDARFRAMEQQACAQIRAWAADEAGFALTEDSVPSLRCVNSSLAWQSHLRHYDSHLLTLLIPLQLAQGAERNGDLLLYKEPRKSVSMLGNLLYKTWLVLQQNRGFTTRERQTNLDLAQGRCRRIACLPGHAYAFNGFLLLHANLDVEFGERRSLVLQYFDPNLTAGIKTVTVRLNKLRERLMVDGK